MGMELQSLAGSFREHAFLFTDLDELDVTDREAVKETFEEFRPGHLINCAAYTAVDKAETDRDTAFLINRTAVGYLADACRETGCSMVHISTDYVFDGMATEPYKEDHPVNPRSVYGRSKLEGERAFLSSGAKGMIIRTSWLYSSFGHNFVKTILRKSKEAEELRVVNDQLGCPTYASDLAGAILQITSHPMKSDGVAIYHYSNEGSCSWFDLAGSIVKITGAGCRVVPISTAAYPTAAERPKYSVLDKTRIRKDFNLDIPFWSDGLARCLDLLTTSNP